VRTVFVGSRNPFNEVILDWLAQRTDVTGVIWVPASAWKATLGGRVQFARRRLRQRGALKTVDEALFYWYYHTRCQRREAEALAVDVIDPYWRTTGKRSLNANAIVTEDVNAPETLRFLDSCQPDAVLAMCIHALIRPEFRRIPKHGVFILHEGIAPEYRGLYSAFWAVHNLEFEKVGATLLRANDQWDAGETFVRETMTSPNVARHRHGYLGHKAIFDALPAIDRFLAQLEAGTAEAIDVSQVQSHYYTYPGFSDLVRSWFRRRRLRSRTGADASSAADANDTRHAGERQVSEEFKLSP
jgi:hypothetical protein